jgi:hypothetical protein
MLQSQHLHRQEMQRSLELHLQAIKQAQEFHESEKALSYALHKDALQKSLNQHIEDIQLTIEAARRENLRDVWAQKSRRAETLLIMCSLMISGFFTLVVEGVPPTNAAPTLIVFFAAFLALGFTTLLSSLFVTMKYQSRMSNFNIYNVRQIYTCGQRHEAFESYYECHCSRAAKTSTVLFYFGTGMLLCAATLLQFSRWSSSFDNVTAGSVYVGIAGCGLLILVAINFFTDTKTRAENTMSDAEAAEQDAHKMDRGQMGDNQPIRRVLSNDTLAAEATASSHRRGVKLHLRRRKVPSRVASAAESERAAFNEYLDQRSQQLRAQSTEVSFEGGGGGMEKSYSEGAGDMMGGGNNNNNSVPNNLNDKARDPGNLESTLGPSTRRRLMESQHNVSASRASNPQVTRLRQEQVEIDMDLFDDKDKSKDKGKGEL